MTDALFSLTTGYYNTAIGFKALYSNCHRHQNTASGLGRSQSNTTAATTTRPTVCQALRYNTTGWQQHGQRSSGAQFNTTGTNNTASRCISSSCTTAVRRSISQSAIIIGAGCNLTTGNNNIDIGNAGVAAEANTIRIGNANQTNTYIAGISGVTVSGAPVVVASDGHLGTADIGTLQGPPVLVTRFSWSTRCARSHWCYRPRWSYWEYWSARFDWSPRSEE